MYITNKFLLIILLAQPFTLMGPDVFTQTGGEVPIPVPAGTPNRVKIGLYILTGSLTAIANSLSIYEHLQKIWLKPLQKETAEIELEFKKEQLKNAKIQGFLELVQLAKDTHNAEEKTGDEAREKEVNSEEARIDLFTKVWKAMPLLVQPPKYTPKEQEEKIKKLARKNTEEQLEKSWEKIKKKDSDNVTKRLPYPNQPTKQAGQFIKRPA